MPDEKRTESIEDLLAAAFEGEPVPRLSPAFESRLERRLAREEGARRRLPTRHRGLLAAYWTAAAAASAAILANLDPTAFAGLPAWPIALALGLTAAGVALPLLALGRAVPGSVGDHL